MVGRKINFEKWRTFGLAEMTVPLTSFHHAFHHNFTTFSPQQAPPNLKNPQLKRGLQLS
jgi:hypothetical protein